jgi:hypothetical protein
MASLPMSAHRRTANRRLHCPEKTTRHMVGGLSDKVKEGKSQFRHFAMS